MHPLSQGTIVQTAIVTSVHADILQEVLNAKLRQLAAENAAITWVEVTCTHNKYVGTVIYLPKDQRR